MISCFQNLAFNCNLRHYIKENRGAFLASEKATPTSADFQAGPYTSPLTQLNSRSREPATTQPTPLTHSAMLKLS